jgi:hypothetical protein
MFTFTHESSGMTFSGFWLQGYDILGSDAISVTSATLYLKTDAHNVQFTNFYSGISANDGAWVMADGAIIGISTQPLSFISDCCQRYHTQTQMQQRPLPLAVLYAVHQSMIST